MGERLATFGGGCFWCLQPAFDSTPGVSRAVVGYMGGEVVDPTYEQICSGTTGHVEVIQVSYDPDQVSYEELLTVFWRQIDPTQENGQFCDLGSQYRTVVFTHDEAQRIAAEQSKADLDAADHFDKPIVTTIEPAVEFYPGEDYHQAYYQKNRLHYEAYKNGSGRAAFIKRVWG